MNKSGHFFKTNTWLFALLLIFTLTFTGFLISKFINNYLLLWLMLVFSTIFSLNKWFENFTVRHKNFGKLYRLLLNCAILSLLGLIIYSGVQLFTNHFLDSQIIGSMLFITEIVLFIWLWRIIKNNSWRWPSMKLTTFSLVGIFLIFAFAGIKPIAEYKNDIIEKITSFISTQKEAAETRSAEKKAEEIERLRHLGITDPSVVVEDLPTNKELQIGLEVLEKVNAIRKERGSSELQWDDKLYEYSLSHAQNMAAQKSLFHSSMYESYAENAWGGEGSKSWTAQTIVDSWMESDKHRTWLLCPNLCHVAVGIAYSTNGMYSAWTFWRSETTESDWWYQYSPENPPKWWY
jgi:uncharacterized protein YkwD